MAKVAVVLPGGSQFSDNAVFRSQKLFELATGTRENERFCCRGAPPPVGVVCWEANVSSADSRIRQCEGHLDLSLYLDGNSVDRGGAVAPLPDGFESGFG